jgi:hypothetical protein
VAHHHRQGRLAPAPGALRWLRCAASKLSTVVDFWFGSSWGSKAKDAARSDGGAVVVPPPTIPALPAPSTPQEPTQPAPETAEPAPEPVSVDGIGRSTSESTAGVRSDVPSNGVPASIRYNNPGAQYPSARAAAFGQLGYGIIGGGNKIARFPHPVNGAAANFDLLRRKYVGMAIGAAGAKWTGDNGFGIPGYDPNAILTAEMLDDPVQAIAVMKAMARREAGRESPLTDEQWRQAHAMFKAGGANAWLSGAGHSTESPPRRPSGGDIVVLARKHIGEKYVLGTQVPKDAADYKGPWDCAEFASWLVYQTAGKIFGCVDDSAAPAKADAYTGSWDRDAHALGTIVSKEVSAATPGAFLLRTPNGGMGHIVVSDGQGGTIEAASSNTGVIAGKIDGRRWDYGILPPGIDYGAAQDRRSVQGPAIIYAIGQPNLNIDKVKEIQKAVGIDADGEYGPATAAAVTTFQQAHGLIADGEVGPDTSKALGIVL